MNDINLKLLKDEEIAGLYGELIKELTARKIIRTKNVVGELGEYLVVRFYNQSSNLPNLEFAPVNEQSFDAIDKKLNKRYSIKSTTTGTTSIFTGLNKEGDKNIDKEKFEYAIICILNDNYQIAAIYEIDWETFLKHKKWHKTSGSWYLTVTKSLISDSKTIYKQN